MGNRRDIAAILVAANLPSMKNMTYQTYLTDPAARGQIDAAARSVRAQTAQRYLFAPLARFCGKLVSIRGVGLHLDPRVGAILAVVAAMALAEAAPIENDLDGNATALIASA
jgi:hypothetical protein